MHALLNLRWCAATAVLLASTSALLTCQESRERAPGAVMLKRIAEAVDGDRSGRLVYVVASYDGSNPVLGVFTTQKEAEANASKDKNAAVFGPYQTLADSTIAQTVTCVHLNTSVMYFRCVPPGRAARFDDITGMTLMVSLADGSRDSIPIPRGRGRDFCRECRLRQVRDAVLRASHRTGPHRTDAERPAGSGQALGPELGHYVLEPGRAFDLAAQSRVVAQLLA